MITRKIGKILRGRTTPFQVFSACLLGSWIAFMPGLAQAPGLILFFGLSLLLLNANLGLALLVGAGAKLVSLLAMPLSFAAGRYLLDGPSSGLFRALINAPVLAWFGFENYTATGGLATGGVFGLVLGFLAVRGLGAFRRKLAGLEDGSERYQAFVAKRWVRAGTFVFVGGGKGKATYGEILQRKGAGNPVRFAGVGAAALVCLGLFASKDLLTSSVLTGALKSGLERANGATVDVGQVALTLGEGRLSIDGVAMADPEALERDLLRGLHFEADVNGMDLLRGRLSIDRLAIREATHGEYRHVPGVRIRSRDKEESDSFEWKFEPGEKSLEEYLADAEQLKKRLAQVRGWVERLSRGDRDETDQEGGGGLYGELNRRVRESGLARVRAEHLIDSAPRLLISELVIEGITGKAFEGDVLDVHMHNISTHPSLVSQGPRIEASTRSGSFSLLLGLDPSGKNADDNRIELEWRGLEVDRFASDLEVDGRRPIRGGTLDLSLRGGWSGGKAGLADLLLIANLHDSNVTIPGHEPFRVESFDLPISLRGPLDHLAVRIDDDELVSALIAAGKREIAERLRSELTGIARERGGELVEEIEGALEERLGGALGEQLGDALGEGPGAELGGELEERLGERARGLFEGALGRP